MTVDPEQARGLRPIGHSEVNGDLRLGDEAPAVAASELGRRARARAFGPGLAWAIAVGAVAWAVGRAVPVVGGPLVAIALGALVRAVRDPGAAARPGIAFASRTVLQTSIVLLGTGIGLGRVLHVGGASLPVMLGTVAVALAGAVVAGRLLRVDGVLRTLVGVGTGICGASAIAAVSGIVGAAELEIAYAISTIFLFNLVALVLFPVIGHAFGMGADAFGLWAGTAINDTSSVVAAGYAYSHAAGDYAVIVKLTRTTLLIPVALGLLVHRLRGARAAGVRLDGRRLVPWFLVLFVLASVANSAGAFPARVQDALSQLSLFLIAVALAGVGLSIRFGELRRTGLRPLLLGLVVWALVASSSIGLQAATGKL